jgi:pyruvate-formate lyase
VQQLLVLIIYLDCFAQNLFRFFWLEARHIKQPRQAIHESVSASDSLIQENLLESMEQEKREFIGNTGPKRSLKCT